MRFVRAGGFVLNRAKALRIVGILAAAITLAVVLMKLSSPPASMTAPSGVGLAGLEPALPQSRTEASSASKPRPGATRSRQRKSRPNRRRKVNSDRSAGHDHVAHAPVSGLYLPPETLSAVPEKSGAPAQFGFER